MSKNDQAARIYPSIDSYSPVYQMAFGWLMKHEGGLSIWPEGITNFGVVLRDLEALGELGDLNADGLIDAEDIRDMTPEFAAWFFHREFWEKYKYEDLPGIMTKIKIFDLAVVMGPHQAHVCVQRALLSSGRHIAIDGILGPISRRTLGEVQGTALLTGLRSEAAGVFRLIARIRPEYENARAGWENRAYDIAPGSTPKRNI